MWNRIQNKRRAAKHRAFTNKMKDVPCMDCGGRFAPYVMQFDHRDPNTKLFNIGNGCTRSVQSVLDEIAKCDIVCANCHAERTWGAKCAAT